MTRHTLRFVRRQAINALCAVIALALLIGTAVLAIMLAVHLRDAGYHQSWLWAELALVVFLIFFVCGLIFDR